MRPFLAIIGVVMVGSLFFVDNLGAVLDSGAYNSWVTYNVSNVSQQPCAVQIEDRGMVGWASIMSAKKEVMESQPPC